MDILKKKKKHPALARAGVSGFSKPKRTPKHPSKSHIVVVKDGDKVKIVRFGDPNMSIKRDDPARLKNFRARHNCDNPGPKTKARYWSCFQWRAGAKVDN